MSGLRISILLLLLGFTKLMSQDSLRSFQPSFYNHLLKEHLYSDAHYYLSIQGHLPDSILVEHLLLTRQLSGGYDHHKAIFDSIDPEALLSPFRRTRYLALLVDDHQMDKLHSLLTSPSFAYRRNEIEATIGMLEQKNLLQLADYNTSSFYSIADKYSRFRAKSSLAAASLSLVPGLGKVYLGYPYQGISSLLVNTLLFAQMAESFHVAGPKSIRFGLTASVFTVFYIGNIYGSYIAARKQTLSFYHQIQHEIAHYYFSDSAVF